MPIDSRRLFRAATAGSDLLPGLRLTNGDEERLVARASACSVGLSRRSSRAQNGECAANFNRAVLQSIFRQDGYHRKK
jgi:hypothetical protein